MAESIYLEGGKKPSFLQSNLLALLTRLLHKRSLQSSGEGRPICTQQRKLPNTFRFPSFSRSSPWRPLFGQKVRGSPVPHWRCLCCCAKIVYHSFLKWSSANSCLWQGAEETGLRSCQEPPFASQTALRLEGWQVMASSEGMHQTCERKSPWSGELLCETRGQTSKCPCFLRADVGGGTSVVLSPFLWDELCFSSGLCTQTLK